MRDEMWQAARVDGMAVEWLMIGGGDDFVTE